ncbi:MAG: helix-turn-helix transcriptional regulator [bacterium]|nr:helix-turn-helix transcriptional regulator [bacterium]
MADKKRTDYKAAVGGRLEQLRKHLSFDAKTMVYRMRISEWSYRQYKQGNHLPGLPSLRSLVKEFNLSLDWLFYGKGPMIFRDDSEVSRAAHEALEAERAKFKETLEKMKAAEAERNAAEADRKAAEAEKKAAEAEKKVAEAKSIAAEEEKNRQILQARQNDPFYREMQEMKYIMQWVPAVRHTVMGFYQKVKEEQKDLIQRELQLVEDKKTPTPETPETIETPVTTATATTATKKKTTPKTSAAKKKPAPKKKPVAKTTTAATKKKKSTK